MRFFKNYKGFKELKAEEIVKIAVCAGTIILNGFSINAILKKTVEGA